jgi:hypothetical protein
MSFTSKQLAQGRKLILPAYKRQHYLPACYLKNFSINPDDGRNALVWRFDGSRSREVRVESQCRSNYFYSKDRAASAEKMFGTSEQGFIRCLQLVESGDEPSEAEYFGLLLLMFDFHIRTAAYENATGADELAAYGVRTLAIKRIIAGQIDGIIEPTDDSVLMELKNAWSVSILISPPGQVLFTSNHPAILWGNQQTVKSVILPLTPRLVAVGCNERFVTVEGHNLTEMDTGALNRMQCINVTEALYSPQRFGDEFQNAVSEEMKMRTMTRGKTSLNGCELGLLKFPITALSFLRSIPKK